MGSEFEAFARRSHPLYVMRVRLTRYTRRLAAPHDAWLFVNCSLDVESARSSAIDRRAIGVWFCVGVDHVWLWKVGSRMASYARRWRQSPWRIALALISLLALAGCSLPSGMPFAGASGSSNSVTIPVQIRHGADGSALVVVDITVNGKGPYAFALDTGASLSLIDSDLAQQLRLPVTGQPVDVSGVGGKQRVTPVKVSVWAMGAETLPARTITSATLPDLRRSAGIVGLLGSDVLSAFSSVTIDYANSDIVVTSPPSSS